MAKNINNVGTYLGTFHSFFCPFCDKENIVDNGNENDLSGVDIEAAKCWNCGKLFWLRDQTMRNQIDKTCGMKKRKIEDAIIEDGQKEIKEKTL